MMRFSPHLTAWAGVLFLFTVAGRAAEDSGEKLYSEWVKRYDEDKVYDKLQMDDPPFVELLKRPDADLFFLRGLAEPKEAIRRLSQYGLAQLKTDRSFDLLAKQLQDKDARIRYRAMVALADFRQPRCVQPLLTVLRGNPETHLRAAAAVRLARFPKEMVKSDLLEAMQGDVRVAQAAAFALGGLQVEEAIQPTYKLALSDDKDLDRNYVIAALGLHRNKKAVACLIDLLEHIPKDDYATPQPMAHSLDRELRKYVQQTTEDLHLVPTSLEKWKSWWAKAKPEFTSDMQWKKAAATSREGVAPPGEAELANDPSQLTFRVSLDAETYRVADPIAIDFAMENRSASPLRTIPPMTGWSLTAYEVRLERLSNPPWVLLDRDVAAGGSAHSMWPGFCTFGPGDTFFRRECLHAWLLNGNEGIWPLPEGSYRLTVTFDNAAFPANPNKFDDAQYRQAYHKAAGISYRAGPLQPGELLHRWQAPPVEFTVAGAARTDPEDLLDLIGDKSGRTSMKNDLLTRTKDNRQASAAFEAARYWADSRLVPVLRRQNSFDFYWDSRPAFFSGHYGNAKLRGAATDVAPASDSGDKPVVEGVEGKRAFLALAAYYDKEQPISPAISAIRGLESANPAERARNGEFLVALLAQSLAEETNGSVPWQGSFVWGGGMENRARDFGKSAYQFAARATAPEAFDAAMWFIEHDPVTENQGLGIKALCQIDSPKTEGAFRRLLAEQHPNEWVLVGVLGQVTMRKLQSLAPEVGRLTGHYRTAVRTAARNAAIALGSTDLPPYCAEDAFTPRLEALLKDIAAMADGPIKDITKDRPSALGITIGSYPAGAQEVAAATSQRGEVGQKQAKAELSGLQEEAKALLNVRIAPAQDGAHSAVHSLSRMGSLTAQFEPQFITLQEAVVAAQLYQRGDKKTTAALLFPRIDATGDDRWIRQAVRDLIGTVYHLEMLTAFADTHDYESSLRLAKHLAQPAFNGYWYQDRAKELAEQLPGRAEDFKTFRLPGAGEWAELKKTLTRQQQIEYLAKHLRLLKGFQHSQPGSVTYDVPQKEGINPFMVLRAMNLEIAELPLLVPFLADETFTPTYGYWRDFHPARDLHRVNRVVAAVINEAAGQDLAQLAAFTKKDQEGRRKHLDEIIQWCHDNVGKKPEKKAPAGFRGPVLDAPCAVLLAEASGGIDHRVT